MEITLVLNIHFGDRKKIADLAWFDTNQHAQAKTERADFFTTSKFDLRDFSAPSSK